MEDQGVDPNLRDGDGATPLHFAASRGHLTAVRWLLSHGARLSLDKYGKSPINDAAENQQVECLNVLVQHGAVPDQNSSGSSNYEGSVYRTKVAGSNSGKKYGSHNYYNTPPQNLLHQSTPVAVAAPPPKIKIPKSPESTSNSCSSDTEPFYLHPPSVKSGAGGPAIMGPIVKDGLIYGAGSVGSGSGRGGSMGPRQSSTSPVDYGPAVLPNDGLYVNPMRGGSLTPPSPGGSISGESFYLHDPQEVIYNRVKDLFDSDSSSVHNSNSNNYHPHANGNTNTTAGSPANKDGSGSSHKSTNAVTGRTGGPYPLG